MDSWRRSANGLVTAQDDNHRGRHLRRDYHAAAVRYWVNKELRVNRLFVGKKDSVEIFYTIKTDSPPSSAVTDSSHVSPARG